MFVGAIIFATACFIFGSASAYKQSSEHVTNKYPTANIQFGEAGNPNLDDLQKDKIKLNGYSYYKGTRALNSGDNHHPDIQQAVTTDYFKNRETGQVFIALLNKDGQSYTILDDTENFTVLQLNTFKKLYEPTAAPQVQASKGGR